MKRPLPSAETVAAVTARVARGGSLLERSIPGGLGVAGTVGTLLGFFAPGVAHGITAVVGGLAVVVHLLAAGWLLTGPVLEVVSSLGRRFVTRWTCRAVSLGLAATVYPLVALPFVGALLPAALGWLLLRAHRLYLLWQLQRDARGESLLLVESLFLGVCAFVTVGVILLLVLFAAGVGYLLQRWVPALRG